MIYIIDDDESVRVALLLLMRSADCEAQAFASAEEFLDKGKTSHTMTASFWTCACRGWMVLSS